MKPLLHILLLLCVVSPLAWADLTIKGSDTLGAKMVPQLAEAYQKLHPAIGFEIAAEGSSSCFKNLLAGSCDIGMASRPVLESELKEFKAGDLTLKKHVVAYDMIAVVVNDKNPVKTLTLKQVEQIFTGEITSWKGLGGEGEINVYTRNTSSGTYKTFQKLAMSGRNYGEDTQKVAGSFHPCDSIAPDSQSIGYCGLAYTKVKGIKPLKIDGVEPAVKRVHHYPLSRDLFFYTVGNMTPEIENFIGWVQGAKEAHAIIERVGFIPTQPQNPAAEQDGGGQAATRAELK